MAHLVIDCPGGQDKGAYHNEQVEQLERFMKNLAAKRMHRKELLNLFQRGDTGNAEAPHSKIIEA